MPCQAGLAVLLSAPFLIAALDPQPLSAVEYTAAGLWLAAKASIRVRKKVDFPQPGAPNRTIGPRVRSMVRMRCSEA